MPSFKLTLQYDGTDFAGWQRQADDPTVQGALEDALARLDGRAVSVLGAGRTDAGVHALGQVAGCAVERDIDGPTMRRALNALLPSSVRVVRADAVSPEFHARFDAREKTYRYLIDARSVAGPFERRFAWHVPQRLDTVRMADAARDLVGRHDFAAFRSTGSDVTTTERTLLSATVGVWPAGSLLAVKAVVGDGREPHGGPEDGGGLVAIELRGTGFLRHMVRAIAGTLVEIGHGTRGADGIRLALGSRERDAAGPTAPAHGLFLVRVGYDPAPDA